jgi:hypothetical protein
MNPKHSSKTNLWYTPEWLIEKCRGVLGPIDFDPASDQFGNAWRVCATAYWEHSALELPWPKVKTVFLNPPGGKIGNQSQAALFWAKFMNEWAAGKFEHGIFIGFSIEIMQTAQQVCGVPPHAFPFCVPSSRFGFDDENGVEMTSPPHAPVIIYVPKLDGLGHSQSVKKFRSVFANVGWCGGMGYHYENEE